MLTWDDVESAYARYHAAELAWAQELYNVYGKNATEYRYQYDKYAATPRLAELHSEYSALQRAYFEAYDRYKAQG